MSADGPHLVTPPVVSEDILGVIRGSHQGVNKCPLSVESLIKDQTFVDETRGSRTPQYHMLYEVNISCTSLLRLSGLVIIMWTVYPHPSKGHNVSQDVLTCPPSEALKREAS